MNSFYYDEISSLKQPFTGTETSIEVIDDCFGLAQYISALSSAEKNNSNKIYIRTIDFTDGSIVSADEFFSDKNNGDECIFIEIFDFEKSFPGGVTALSEREVYALTELDSEFAIAKSVKCFEDELKKYVGRFNIKVLRYTNIYGPECKTKGALNNIFARFSENKQIEISTEDYIKFISVSYISSVINDIMSVIKYGKSGNVYNGSNKVYTVAEIKNTIYKLFVSEGASLKFEESDESEEKHFALSCRKIKGISDKMEISLEESILKTLCNDECLYIKESVKNNYDGKIIRIREEEKSILLEVDRICQKNNINYYLVGGSLLGAVRHKGFIPWDDDVDICMLREDFEKFRKVCPKELSEKYAYQSYRDEKTTHYIYDKIRLKGTYFSSEHSGRYDNMENGIFLDIFVFDKTANLKFLQKLHVFLIVMMRRLIHIRWTKEPVSGKFAFISKLILPLVCLFPFSFSHNLFEFILRFYEKSKKSRFVLDGIGLYVKKGALPLSWVTDNTPVDFEGISLPGVKDSNSYLSMWYGKNYMTPPPVSKRMSGHSISRLDLGSYLFKNQSENEISLKGELYDK